MSASLLPSLCALFAGVVLWLLGLVALVLSGVARRAGQPGLALDWLSFAVALSGVGAVALLAACLLAWR